MKDVRYPIGKYYPPQEITSDHIMGWLHQIRNLPLYIREQVSSLSKEQLKASYRKGGWDIHELIYHLTDSHYNSYIRYKWTLTENKPVIKAYDEKAWGQTKDVYAVSILDLLGELKVVQNRICRVVSTLNEKDLKRSYIHPESNMEISLAVQTGMYAWHGMHHLAHIKMAITDPVTTYIPVECGFYDELALYAMRNKKLTLNISGKNLSDPVIIKDLQTKNKEEFIYFDNGQSVRLDEILKVEEEVIYLK